jgi:hypothetical protein
MSTVIPATMKEHVPHNAINPSTTAFPYGPSQPPGLSDLVERPKHHQLRNPLSLARHTDVWLQPAQQIPAKRTFDRVDQQWTETLPYDARPPHLECCWYCQEPGHMWVKCKVLQGDKDVGICSLLSGRVDVWFMGKQTTYQPNCLRIPFSWIKDNRGAYALRLLIFAYIRAIKQWYCPSYEPYYAMTIRLGGEHSFVFTRTMMGCPCVDFERYVIGYHNRDVLMDWGFNIEHYRETLHSVYPEGISQEKTEWRIPNAKAPSSKRRRKNQAKGRRNTRPDGRNT